MPRRRYVYRQNENGDVEAIEVGADYSDAPRSTGDLGKFQYDNLQATDGTPIDSRTKHRAYMKANGLAMADDYKETWAKARKEREAVFTGNFDREGRRQDVARALYNPRRKR